MGQYMNRHASPPVLFAFALLFGTNMGAQSKSGVAAEVVAVYPRSEALYLDLHQHPELSFHEVETAAKRRLGSRTPRIVCANVDAASAIVRISPLAMTGIRATASTTARIPARFTEPRNPCSRVRPCTMTPACLRESLATTLGQS